MLHNKSVTLNRLAFEFVTLQTQAGLCLLLVLSFAVVYFRGWAISVLADGAYMLSFDLCLIGLSGRYCGSAFLRQLGRYSMEIYLVHSFLLNYGLFSLFHAERGVSYYLLFAFTFAISIPIFLACSKLTRAVLHGDRSNQEGRSV